MSFRTGSYTASANFPVANALQPKLAGALDAFVTKLSPDGATLVYSTYIGGANWEKAGGIAVDSTGAAYVTGFTTSTNFPVKNPLQAALGGKSDAFLAKITPDGSALAYSTYFGGSGIENVAAISSTVFPPLGGIAVDAQGQAVIVGYTASTNLPVAHAVQAAISNPFGFATPSPDAFVARFAADGASLVFATYLGGVSYDWANAVALDSAGNVHVAGQTESFDFPVVAPFQAKPGSGSQYDAFAAKLAPDGSKVIYATYLGGGGEDIANAIAIDGSGRAVIAGTTSSPNFPVADPLQAVGGASLYESTDGGATWNARSAGIRSPTVRAVVRIPGAPGSLLAGTGSGVYRSVDGGATWTATSVNGNTSALLVDPSDPKVIYAGSDFSSLVSGV